MDLAESHELVNLETQGMAFLSRYRELRGETDEGLDEVEFNFGRIFHHLGRCRLLSFVEPKSHHVSFK